MLNQYAKSDLESMVGTEEQILWQGRPNKLCSILEGIFNPLLPVALLWLLCDAFVLFCFLNNAKPTKDNTVILFLLIHALPIWIYIAGVLFTFRKYKHTEYIITDKGVYISGGIFAYTCQMKSYMDISSINIHRGVFDQQLKVGDVVFSSVLDETNTQIISNNNPNSAKLSISNISDYQQVFNLVKKLQIDVFSDTMYPNDLRPAENHGYKTKYKGL